MSSSLQFRNNMGFHVFTDTESNKDILEVDYESYSKYWYIEGNTVVFAYSEEVMHNHCFTGDLDQVYSENFETKFCTPKCTILLFQYGDSGEIGATMLNNDNMVDKDRLSKLSVFS